MVIGMGSIWDRGTRGARFFASRASNVWQFRVMGYGIRYMNGRWELLRPAENVELVGTLAKGN